jgi:hypothetical protein
MMTMQAIELDATITESHEILLQLPDTITASKAKVIVMYDNDSVDEQVDLMKYSGTIAWQEDGLAYQQAIRTEWDDAQ